MVLTTTNSNGAAIRAYSGTLQEVLDALDDHRATHRVGTVFHDGVNFVAIVRLK